MELCFPDADFTVCYTRVVSGTQNPRSLMKFLLIKIIVQLSMPSCISHR